MSITKIIYGAYDDLCTLNSLFNYCLETDYPNQSIEWGGRGVVLENKHTAIDSFNAVKSIYDKFDGKQAHHLVISIYRRQYIRDPYDFNRKRMLDNMCCNYIAIEVAQLIFNKGYQVCYFKHTDTDYLHLHLIINSVNYLYGNKLTNLLSFRYMIDSYLKEHYPHLQWR